MAIKKIIFKNLSTNNYSLTAIGGIRFYDYESNIIQMGTLIQSTPTSGESSNFIVISTDTYSIFHVLNAFDTTQPEIGSYTTPNYWASSADNQILICEFKMEVENLSKITFVPVPGLDSNNQGTTDPFSIEVYDENLKFIVSYDVTPITQRAQVQTLITPELMNRNVKIFIPNPNVTVPKDTEYQFNFSIDAPIFSSDITQILSTSQTQLGTGTMFSALIEKNKWQNISMIEVK